MATTTTTNWQLSATGSDTNGGCFDPSFGGTDYSQQDVAQASFANGVTTTGSPTFTSASGPFTNAMVGNGVNIAGVVYQLIAIGSATSVTLDRNVTTGASALSCKVGGSLLTVGYASGQHTACTATANDTYVGSGTYLISSSLTNVSNGRVTSIIGGSSTKPYRWIGHNAGDRTDRTVAPNVTIIINNTAMQFSGTNTVNIENILVTGIGGASTGINVASGHILYRVKVYNCKVFGFTGSLSFFFNCEADTCADGFNGRFVAYGCSAHNCTLSWFSVTAGSSQVNNCSSWSNVTGYTITNNVSSATNCLANGNSSHGFTITNNATSVILTNCLSCFNGGFGYTSSVSSSTNMLYYCAGWSNTSGNTSPNITNNTGFKTLTANPFTNAAGLDFSLNNVAGGGALLRNLGFPTTIPGSNTTSYMDIGPTHHADLVAAGGMPVIGSSMIRGTKNSGV